MRADYQGDDENRIEIDTDSVWEADELQKLPRQLRKKGGVEGTHKKLVNEFAEYVEKYDRSFCYSQNGTLTVVFCHEDDEPVYLDGDIAMMDINFGEDQVSLMMKSNIEAIDDIDGDFFEYAEEMMEDNGWELEEEANIYGHLENEPIFWVDDCEEAVIELIDALEAQISLTAEDKAVVDKFRGAMQEAVGDIQIIITDQAVNAIFEIENPEYDEDDEDDEETEETIAFSFGISRMNGGAVFVVAGEDFANISAGQGYIDHTAHFLERNNKGGLFGKGEAFVLQTETVKDDALAMALIDGLSGRQSLESSELAIINQLKSTYSDYQERMITFYQGIMQMVCMNGTDTDHMSFFMYSSNGESIAAAANGNSNSFSRDADSAYTDFVKELLTRHGLDKWLKGA